MIRTLMRPHAPGRVRAAIRTCAYLACATGFVLAQAAAAQETSQSLPLDEMRAQALDLVNESREAEGLEPLRPDDTLHEAAQVHAVDMQEQSYLAHVSPDGETPRDRYMDAGGNKWAVSAENVAACQGCPTPPGAERIARFHEGWMQSLGHRENILNEGFETFGFGISSGSDAVYAAQTFAGPGTPDGVSGDVRPVTAQEAREEALRLVNAERATAGLDRLDPSEALDTVARRALETRDDGQPQTTRDLSDLLPEGQEGRWRSLRLLSATRGGAGERMTAGDIEGFVEDWAAAGDLGGDVASLFGFASQVPGDGRKAAVAVFAAPR